MSQERLSKNQVLAKSMRVMYFFCVDLTWNDPAVIMSQEYTQPSGHANVSNCLLIFQHRIGNDTTVSVYVHL